MLSTSLKTADKAIEFPPQIWPHPMVPQNYLEVVSSQHTSFPLWARNSLIIAILTVAGTTLSSAIVAYGFAKIPFRGRGFLFILLLSTMMIPFPVTMVPLFSHLPPSGRLDRHPFPRHIQAPSGSPPGSGPPSTFSSSASFS